MFLCLSEAHSPKLRAESFKILEHQRYVVVGNRLYSALRLSQIKARHNKRFSLISHNSVIRRKVSTLSQTELTLRPLEVVVDGDNVERAIKALKRKVAHEGIYKELKRRRFYEKPSVKRKRKQREAERRRRKERRRALRANVRRR